MVATKQKKVSFEKSLKRRKELINHILVCVPKRKVRRKDVEVKKLWC